MGIWRGRMRGRGVWALVAAVGWSAALFGQVLSDRVPDDAVLYVGWRGSDALGAQYEESRLKSVVGGTDLSILQSGAFRDQVADAIARKDPQQAHKLRTIFAVIRETLQYPSALYVGAPAPAPAPGQNEPRIAIIAQPGAAAGSIVQRLGNLLPADEWQLEQAGEYVIAAYHLDERSWAMIRGTADPAGSAPLSADSAFVEAMRQVGGAPAAISVYGNIERLLASLPPNQVSSGLGLDGIRRVAFSAGFAGKDWAYRAFIDAPHPRRGLARLLDGKPVSDATIALVPESAELAFVAHCDAPALWDELRTSMARHGAATVQQFDTGVGNLNRFLGTDLRQELLPLLGDEWAIFGDTRTGGTTTMGWVAANRPKDPDKVGQMLKRIQDGIVTVANAGLADKKLRVASRSIKVGQVEVNTIPLPLAAPSWAIHDGVLYLGWYPQTVGAAASRASHAPQAGKRGTLLENPAFAALQKQSGNTANAIFFLDLPRTLDAGYMRTLQMSRWAGYADLWGIETPLMAVPPLPLLHEQLGPSCSWAVSDGSGWHAQSITPFPGAMALAYDATGDLAMLQTLVLPAIIIPQFADAGEDARLSAVRSTVQTVRGQCELYRLQHQDQYPDFAKYPNWEQLIARTNPDGTLAATGRYGPYLQRPAINPLRRSSRVLVFHSMPAIVSDPDAGWIVVYRGPRDQRFYALDENGKPLGD